MRNLLRSLGLVTCAENEMYVKEVASLHRKVADLDILYVNLQRMKDSTIARQGDKIVELRRVIAEVSMLLREK